MNASTVKSYLQLVRLPNTFTAAADVTAGLIFGGATWHNWPMAGALIVASMCLYAGGVALNDVCDASRDRIDRPERPIPSGRIRRDAALKTALALLALGAALAITASPRSGLAAALLLCAIILYDYVLKRTPAAPLLMGGCRALNLALGLFALAAPGNGRTLLPMGIIWLYVTSVTYFARKEASGGSPARLLLGSAGIVAALALLLEMPSRGTNDHVAFTVCVILAALGAAALGLRAAIASSARATQSAVAWFVSGIVLLDACLAWSTTGPLAGLLVAAWLVPVVLLGRTIRLS